MTRIVKAYTLCEACHKPARMMGSGPDDRCCQWYETLGRQEKNETHRCVFCGGRKPAPRRAAHAA